MNHIVLNTLTDTVCSIFLAKWIGEELQKNPGWKRNFFVSIYATGLMSSLVGLGIRLFS